MSNNSGKSGNSDIEKKINLLLHPVYNKPISEVANFIESSDYSKGKLVLIFNIENHEKKLFDNLILKIGEISKTAQVILTTNQQQKQPKSSPPIAKKIAGIKKVIAIASGKGGVGKSTVAQNLARFLSEKLKLKVGLLDADIHGPSLAKMFGVKQLAKINPENNKIIPYEKNLLKLISFGNIIEDQTKPILFRGPLVITALKQLLFDVEWGELDYLIIDFPPGTSDSHMSLCQNIVIDFVILVSSPQEISFLDTQKSLVAFMKFNIKILGLIENFSYFICPNCANQTKIFPDANLKSKVKRFKIPYLGSLPIDPMVAKLSDEGKSFVNYKASDYYYSFEKIVSKII